MVQRRADNKKFSKSSLKKANKTKPKNASSGGTSIQNDRKKVLATKGERSAKKQTKKSAPESFEAAVANARGLPDGAFSDSDDSDIENRVGANEKEAGTSDGEEAMDVSSPQTTPSKKDKGAGKDKKKPSLVSKAVDKIKKGKDTPDAAKKRKSSGKGEAEEEKKPKLEEMSVKERKQIRKMSKSNYQVAAQAKKLWEELRKTNLKPEKRYEVSANLHKIIQGKCKELIFAHDTSRIIQCLMKYGAQDHKNALFVELKGDIVDMAKNKYAKFFVRKLLKYGTKDQRHHVFKSLYGSVRKLIKHKEAAEIIELAYNDYANLQQRQALIEEFYGPSFALFKTPELRSLEQIMTSAPEKKESILSNMKDALTILVSKGVVQFSIVHRVFRDFFHYCSDQQRNEMIQIVRDSVIHMLHTNEGSEVARICLWHGTAKDRKSIVKSMKTFVVKVCKEEYGHLALLALFDCVDDTKLVGKAILEEMLKSVDDVAKDQYGRKVLLYLLAPRDTKHFHPDITKKLVPGDGNENSKKDTDVRRKELLEVVSKPLVQYIAKHCEELVVNNSLLLLTLCILTRVTCDPTEAMIALSKVAAKPYHPATESEGEHVIENSAGNMTYKKLILNDKERLKQEKVLFSGILMDIIPKGTLKSWAACNRGCFLIVNLLELGEPDIVARVKSELEGIAETLKKMDIKGAQILHKKLTAKSTSL